MWNSLNEVILRRGLNFKLVVPKTIGGLYSKI